MVAYMKIKIASFNVRNMSLGNSAKKMDAIAGIVNENDIDIIALQEVLSEGKMLSGSSINSNNRQGQEIVYQHSLISRMKNPDQWSAVWGNPQTQSKYYPYIGSDSRGEGYGFLWNNKRFELPQTSDNKKEIYPRIWRNYHVLDKNSSKLRLVRDPFFGRFIIKDTSVEIRLITTHIVYGKPKDENLNVELDYGSSTMRKNEFNVLAGQIYQRVNDYHMTQKPTVPYTIILGDYNLNLPESGAGSPYVPDIACFDDYGHLLEANGSISHNIYTVQANRSTLSSDGSKYSNNYDHFSFDERTREEIIKEDSIKIINVGKTVDERKKFRDTVSDHVPIIVELIFK